MTTSTNLLDYIPQGLLAARPVDPTLSPGTHPDAIPFYFATDGGLAAYISGAWVDIPSGSGIGVSDGDKGDIVVSSSGTVWTLDNDAVTYAKIQNVSATDKLLGRSTAGAGDVEEIACTAAGRALIDDADAATQRTTLGLGTAAVKNTGTSGNTVPLLDGANTWSADQIVPDEAYDATNWDASLEVPTKNAIRDKIEDILDGVTFTGDIVVPAEAYGVGWDGSNEVPTKNDVYDKIEAVVASSGSTYEAPPVDEPAVADFAWNNQGGATAIDAVGGGIIITSTASSNNLRQLEKSTPATPFSVYANVRALYSVANISNSCGIGFRNSTNGRVVLCSVNFSTTDPRIIIERWTSVTTFSAAILASVISGGGINWLRVDVTSTGFTFFGSSNGWDWVQLATETFAAFLTAAGGGSLDKYGITFRDASDPCHGWVTSFGLNAPPAP